MLPRILNGDVLSFARHYKGPRFHAMLTDPPYHLTSITKRFGAKNSAPAKDKDGVFQRVSKGFMGKQWDGGDIAFRPETWEALGELLLSGAFCLAFGGSRTAHRMAVAIEDAGFVIHPMLGWVYGSGFPKATRVKDDVFDGHRYGAQALKPALEPIIMFQKPYKGRPLDNIVESGTGALNIDKTRISNRWPANLILQHLPECSPTGQDGDNYQINRFIEGAKPFGDAVGEDFETEEVENKRTIWECAEGCPVRELDLQTGVLKSGLMTPDHNVNSEWGYAGGEREKPTLKNTYADKGGASRFFFQAHYELEKAFPIKYQAKSSKKEKNAGLDLPSTHPTHKPLALTEYLAKLLLPPAEYHPRRIFVPFAGTGSEMIGSHLAGWDDIIGVELEQEYTKIAKLRLQHWCSVIESHQLPLF